MTAQDAARALLRIGAVTLRPDAPFEWASGRLAPVYTDNRLALAHPDVRTAFADALVRAAQPWQPEVVAGTATAGIPLATLVADRLALPLCYVRASAKAHGRGNRIEGRVDVGQRTVVVEDLVSTGGSVLSAAEALQEAGALTVVALAVFSYGLAGVDAAFAAAGLPLTVLTDMDALAAVARDEGRLDRASLGLLDAWRADPSAWSVARGGAA